MCSNYQPVTRRDRLLSFFEVDRVRDEPPADVFPTGLAPFIRLAEPGSADKVVDDGAFGLLLFFAKELAYGRPLAIAGIYTRWKHPEGFERFSFAMLTVNADGHPVFQRMHRPGDEKRMVVILDAADHDAWLSCSVADAPRLFRRWSGELLAEPAPLLRAPRASSGTVVRPALPPSSDSLF